MMKKIAIFGNIYGNYQALDSILKDIDKYSFDNVICLGNLIDKGPNSIDCINAVIDSKVILLMGNEEYFITRDDVELNKKSFTSFLKSLLDDNQKNYLKSLKFSYEILDNGHLFTFSNFFIDNNSKNKYPFVNYNFLYGNDFYNLLEKSDYEYLFCVNNGESVNTYIGKRLFSFIRGSGCTDSEYTSYTILEFNKSIINVRTKIIKYDRKEFIKSFDKSNAFKEYIEDMKSFFNL